MARLQSPARVLTQLGDIRRNPSRLILAEQLGRAVRRSGSHAHEGELFDT
jgi:hypothetical protein